MDSMGVSVELKDIDRRIWQDELEEFVPRRLFDVHTHIYRWEFNTDPNKDTGPWRDIAKTFPESNWQQLEQCDRLLMPGREVHRLSFGFPFSPSCNFEVSNNFAAGQVRGDPKSAALMLVHPSMTAGYLDEQIEKKGFLGFKPYRFFSVTGDADQCRITDFLPEHQIEVAHRRGLLIMLHLSKRDAIADRDNINDLIRLTNDYPNAKWILAHCGRCWSSWPIEKAGRDLQNLHNVWYETSSVCESDAFCALISAVGIDRVMYGSDDIPVGVMRGKYITFGYAWAYLCEANHSMNLSHCNPQMTFTRYEQLRAMRQAVIKLGLTQKQLQDLFFNTAAGLIESVRRSGHG